MSAHRTGLSREQMAWCAAQDLPDGSYVNLGIGIPEKVAEHVPADREIIYHSENGILGFGPTPAEGMRDPDLINAGKKPVSLLPGAAFFHHADSFAMIRGGHVDYSILGAMQVAANGDIANWSTGAEGAISAVGGAMDLAAGARHVHVIMEQTTREGQSKMMAACSFPLTGVGVVDRVYTNFGVFAVAEGRFVLLARAASVDIDAIRDATEGPLVIPRDCPTILLPADQGAGP